MSHLSGMDLNLLVALDALLTARSVTAAAAQLGVTQSAMSRTLARLRAAFGDPLFVRAGRALVPTERAEGLAAPVASLLAEADALLTRGAPFDPATARRELTIYAADLATSLVMPGLVTRLAREAPGIDLATLSDARDTLALLLAERPALGITPQAPDSAELRARPGRTLAFAVILRRDHPALVDGRLDLAGYAAARHLLVAPRGRPGGIVDTVLAERGLTRRVAARIATFAIAGEIVAASDLVATVPRVLAERFVATLPVVAVAPPLPVPSFTLSLVWHERYHHDAGHAWLRAVVLEALGGGGATAP